MQDGDAEQSRHLLAQAREELDKGDQTQALEKLWGATAQTVEAVAQTRGWRHDTDRRLFEAVDRLAKETGDPGLRTAFQVVHGLHFNFYETLWPREFVENGVSLAEAFVNKLEGL